MHVFVKIPRPVDNLDPLESATPILPALCALFSPAPCVFADSRLRYKEPAGQIGGASNSNDPEGEWRAACVRVDTDVLP